MKRGNINGDILILGEAPGENEVRAGRPFVGKSGQELDRMLAEAGISEDRCLFANVCNLRPPDNRIELWMPTTKKEAAVIGAEWVNGKWASAEVTRGLAQLEETIKSMPNLRLIIALGNVPLWATTGQWGITKWRGSQIRRTFVHGHLPPFPVVPTYHPAAVMRTWEWRWIAVLDFKRALGWLNENFVEPKYDFTIRPSYNDSCRYLDTLWNDLENGPVKVSVDIETRSRHIACIGFARSNLSAICIPFLTLSGPYFSQLEEIQLIWRLYLVLTHKNIEVIGQNFLYDRQYIARRWGIRARLGHDTMVKHHLCFPGVPKGLDFISSFYNKFHLYWKDESKDWDPTLGEEQLWIYNCKDAVATYEANEHLDTTIRTFCLERQLAFQMSTAEIAFDMMLRGVRVDLEYKNDLTKILSAHLAERLAFIKKITGIDLEPSSPKQVQSFCYNVLRLPPIYKNDKKKQTRRLTADKEAIEEWLESCEPLFRPILQAIMDYRSLQVYNSTFAQAELDSDNRFRCSINVAGPETFRWSTSEDAFGYGTNMQNIPRAED